MTGGGTCRVSTTVMCAAVDATGVGTYEHDTCMRFAAFAAFAYSEKKKKSKGVGVAVGTQNRKKNTKKKIEKREG